MLNITKKEIEIEDSLKNKIDTICSFSGKTAIIINGCIRSIECTNLIYIEPHRVIIDGNLFLFFNGNDNCYHNNLSTSIIINDLEEYLKFLNYD